MHRSFWIESAPGPDYPPLDGDLAFDVAVLGGGITGITAALLLKEAGKTVALVESDRLVHGVTGNTTAKVTSGHGLIYERLRSSYGAETARVYAESNEAGLALVAETVASRAIDCDFERRANYVYSERGEDVGSLRAEAAAARAAGLEATFVDDVPLPFPVAGAVRLEHQAQFHPRKYLLPLAAAIDGDGSRVFEHTRARDVRDGEPCVVTTERGRIRALHVVLATHLPFLDRGLFFAKAHPAMSYALAAPIEPAAAPVGMFISTSQPTRSIRTAPDGDALLLVLGGEGHKPGVDADTTRRYAALERTLAERFGLADVGYRWSTHDYVPVDDLPYVGALRRGSDRILVATGFAKWGMTKAALSGLILRDAIVGRPNPWAETYAANRLELRHSATSFLKENAVVGARFVADRLSPGRRDAEALVPGEGAIVRDGRRKLAVHRDEAGELHVRSARCTHLGCLVRWNTAERTWDCPCHGSRFAGDGSVVEGPAVSPLPREEL